VRSIREAAEAEIAAGIEFARNGTDPDPGDVTRDVYSPEAA
jgi:TPP-dependent pyruvate/acetoin dehydrogenase alpha subunit